MGLALYNSFKPSPSMGQNVCPHIKSELQLKALTKLVEENEEYRSVYE